jgi:peptide/nickel transport system substrate-binding protein
MTRKRWTLMLICCLLLVSVFFAGCSGKGKDNAGNNGGNTGNTQSGDTGNTGKTGDTGGTAASGGTLKLAWNSQPPTLDTHVTNTNVVRDIARQMYETLLTFNGNYEITPMLAESYEVSDDNKTVTFKLREGVLFHNGKEMKAEDVVASMQRWQQFGTAKAELGNSVWEAEGDYVVKLTLDGNLIPILHRIADPTQAGSIMPKEVIEAADSSGAKDFIGTGPFKLAEWKADAYIHLTKFEDYKPIDLPTSGLSGKKEALVDDIYIYFVPDNSTRVNGVISGEYDYAFELPFTSFPVLDSAKNIVNDVWPYGFETLVFNKKGVFGDARLRKAVNHAIDKEALLSLAFTNEKFYKLEPAYMRPEQINWYTDAGKEHYDVYDVEKAKQLLQEAGYNGEEIVILTSSDYQYHYDSAVVAQQALEAIGMKTRLDVTDWATLLQKRQDPEQWDMFFTQFTTVATPLAYPFLDSRANYPGWTNNPEIDRYLDEIRAASNQEEATAKFKELQAIIWDDLPVINIGMTYFISSYSNKVKGYSEFMGPIFWNVSVEK